MKWGQTAAILAGDLLNNLAYDLVRSIERLPEQLPALYLQLTQ